MFSADQGSESGSTLDGLPALFAEGGIATTTAATTDEVTWVVPTGVTQISAVCIGGGGGGAGMSNSTEPGPGGGGGALAYATLSVTPGESLTVGVGRGGRGNDSPTVGAGGAR